MYSDAEAHLANLDHCSNRELRRAYLSILLGATAAGYEATGRTVGGNAELRIRDHAGRQPFAVDLAGETLRFSIRLPALVLQPGLTAEAMIRFGDWARVSGDEVSIQIRDAEDGERIAEWLFGLNGAATRTELNPEYAERISA